MTTPAKPTDSAADPTVGAATIQPDPSSEGKPTRKAFISPTSSFVDFVELDSEYYTEEGRALANLYNPHKERKIKKPTKDYETCIHLVKGSVGIGLLAMPQAFKHAGWGVAIVGSVLLGALCVYAIHILLKSQLIQCKRLRVPFLTLPRSMRIGFLNGPKCLRFFAGPAPIFVDFFLIAFQLGICTAYVVYIAKSMKSVVEELNGKEIKEVYYILMIFIPVVLINYIRNLKKLTPISLTANVLIILSFFGVIYYIIKGPMKVDDTNAISESLSTWPLFMGTMMFALEAVGVIVALEHNMEFPQHFLGWKGIFPWSLTVVVIMYLTLGLFGYLRYGSEINEVITGSLPKKEALSIIIRVVYAACVFMTYPLQCYVSLEILWGNYLVRHIKDPKKECCIEYILRTVVVIITFAFAIAVPKIDTIISLVGAFCLSFLGVIFPFVLELCTKWPDELGTGRYILIKDIFFIVIGFIMLFSGTYMSLYGLFKEDD